MRGGVRIGSQRSDRDQRHAEAADPPPQAVEAGLITDDAGQRGGPVGITTSGSVIAFPSSPMREQVSALPAQGLAEGCPEPTSRRDQPTAVRR
jgi:hypothetical protein